MQMFDRPYGGSLSGKMKGIFCSLWLALSILVFIGSAALFAVARADWSNLRCREWPQAGYCADAVTMQWILASVALVAGVAGLLTFGGVRDA